MRGCVPGNRQKRRRMKFLPASDLENNKPFPSERRRFRLTRCREFQPGQGSDRSVKSPLVPVCAILAALSGLSACQNSEVTDAAPARVAPPAPASPPPPFQIWSSIQELMDAAIYPWSHALWA